MLRISLWSSRDHPRATIATWPRSICLQFCVSFIYKTLCAPTKTETDVTPAFTLLSRIFLSLIVFQPPGGRRRSVGNRPILQEDSLTPISIVAICVHLTFTLTQ